MYHAVIQDYNEWRLKAREFLYAGISPEYIDWLDTQIKQKELLSPSHSSLLIPQQQTFLIPKSFFDLAKAVACHRDFSKWQKLYLALWRITHGEKHLLQMSSDPLVHTLDLFNKAVRRDCHKMQAFVRFRRYTQGEQSIYVAYHQPDHNIMRRVARFFARRFAVMHWVIITPNETALWDGEALQFAPGIKNFKHAVEDEFEQLWRTYYRSIFNPARIKVSAMKREMPVRYWPNLPESQIISQILLEAPARVNEMLHYTEGFATSAKDYLPKEITLENLKTAATACKACSIFQCGKQTVFGQGKGRAMIMIVGEQPGKEEDQVGLPLIGPSGQFLRQALKKFMIELDTVYFTNAVKHFKHQKTAEKIIYQTPTIKEIYACKPWLENEIAVVKPKIILGLGLVAAKSLISAGFKIKKRLEKLHFYQDIPVWITYHPAAILRIQNKAKKISLVNEFMHDLGLAFKDSL